MFLSENKKSGERAELARLGKVSLYNGSCGVVTEGERRGLDVGCPGGYIWRPKPGQQVLTLSYGQPEKETVIALCGVSEPSGFQPGEVYITSAGRASVHIKNDGSIIINGDVDVRGSLTVYGMPVATASVSS